jgi:hypothetical protein
MKTNTIKTEKELISFLRIMREQSEQLPAEATATDQVAAPAADQQVQPAQARPITPEDIVERLNIIRSGRSTKDLDVKKELEEYIAQFTEEEKTALLAFLEGLGQILTSGVDSIDAADPKDPYDLQIKRSTEASTSTSSLTPSSPVRATAPQAPQQSSVPIKIGGA